MKKLPRSISNIVIAIVPCVMGAAAAHAQTGSGEKSGGVLEEAGIPPSILTGTLYGFIEARFEKSANSPTGLVGSDNKIATEENAHEFDVPAFHVMMQALIADRFRVFFNLASPGSGGTTGDEPTIVRNAWVELPLYQNYFNVRIGKTYRRFGLYNEQLDAVPSFPGIEPPELFDKDHLMLTRTTNFMVHGSINVSDSSIVYALMTGNDERESDQVPIGLDLHVDVSSTLRLGTSFYTTNGDAVPTVGEGSPNGGVVNWMSTDSFYVVGGYGQVTLGPLLLQAEYWRASHKGKRDPAYILGIVAADNPYGINPQQRARFVGNVADPMESDVITEANYSVDTFYARAAYEFALTDPSTHPDLAWTFTPYLQFDYYKNPEVVKEKDVGGDNEAGIAEDGRFIKLTVGGILRPVPQVAVKLDGSIHFQKIAGQETNYPELRLSFAYYWEIQG